MQRKCVWFGPRISIVLTNERSVSKVRISFFSPSLSLVVHAYRSAYYELEQKIVFISAKSDNEARYDIAPFFSLSIYFLSRERKRSREEKASNVGSTRSNPRSRSNAFQRRWRRYSRTLLDTRPRCARHFQTIAFVFLWPLTTMLEENSTALL